MVARLAALMLALTALAGCGGATGSATSSVPPASAASPASAAPSPSPAVPAGFSLLWREDFEGSAGSPPDPQSWRYDIGQGIFGTGEIEQTTDSTTNVYLDGQGHLAIKPIRDDGGLWTSGRIQSKRDDFEAPAGGVLRLEGSLQQPDVTAEDGLGYWPAFWMLGAPFRTAHDWPTSGEIDLMEDVNGRGSVWNTLHCGTAPGGPCNENNGIGSGEVPCPGCQSGFHTYAIELDRSAQPEELRWYLDGRQTFAVNSTQVDEATWNGATHHGFFVILNVAIGGGFPAALGGVPLPTTASGRPMLVDYVAVFTKGP